MGSPPELILVTEDDPHSRTELRLLLEEQGYRVVPAQDARSGLRLAEQHRPDLILQDLLLPDTHGFDLVAQLRALPGGAPLPIVALSGFPEPGLPASHRPWASPATSASRHRSSSYAHW
jgi:CheY-like chemotaxis protein